MTWCEPAHWKPLIPKIRWGWGEPNGWGDVNVPWKRYVTIFIGLGSEEIWIRLMLTFIGCVPNMKKNQPKLGWGGWGDVKVPWKRYVTNRWFLFFFSGLIWTFFGWFSRFWLKIKGFLEKTVILTYSSNRTSETRLMQNVVTSCLHFLYN